MENIYSFNINWEKQARGDAYIDSDWDILIILNKDKLLPDDYDNITFPLTMLG